MKIFALFSIENNYDQPRNNLVGWWTTKPTFDQLAKAVGFAGFPCTDDPSTLMIVNLWQGLEQQDDHATSYRLEELSEGVLQVEASE